MTQALQGQGYEKATVLYMALELSKQTWKVCFGDGARRRMVTVGAGDRSALLTALAKAKAKFGLAGDVRVVSGYEAGRDGFWIHRWLVSEGIDNRVMDASSIEVPRQRRWAKTDRIDVGKLLELLLGEGRGERGRYRQVRVPSEADEAARRLHRERETLLAERGRYRNRLSGLLATHGIVARITRGFGERLRQLTDWRGERLSAAWLSEFERLWQRLTLVDEQLQAIEREQAEVLRHEQHRTAEQMRQLRALKGLDVQIPWTLVHELFGWRQLRNGREVGALAGLTPTPFRSGELRRELGISKRGVARVRRVAVELAWLWVRYQPDSALSRWFEARFAHGGSRQRRVGIVALARKLLIALWRYLETGVLPEGALVKAG